MEDGRLIYLIPSIFLFVSGSLLFKFLNVSARRALLLPLKLPLIFLGASESLTFSSIIYQVLMPLFEFIVPLLPISIGFGLLALYGSNQKEDKKVAVFSILPASIAGILLSGFSPVSVLFYGALLLCSVLVTGYGETYSEELDMWKNFRTGTSSTGKIFLILSVFLTVGLVVNVSSNLEVYKGEYVNTSQDMLGKITGPENVNTSQISDQELVEMLPEKQRENLNSLPEDQRKEALSEMKEEMVSQQKTFSKGSQEIFAERILKSEKVSRLIEFSLLMTAVAIGGVFLFLSKVLFGPIAGLTTLLSRST